MRELLHTQRHSHHEIRHFRAAGHSTQPAEFYLARKTGAFGTTPPGPGQGPGGPKIKGDTAQGIGVENFLRGCKDKAAAYTAAEHQPETIQIALQSVEDSVANLKTFERPAVTARQFTFAEPEVTDPAMASLKKQHGRLLRMMSDVFSGLDVDLACCSETEASRRRTSPSPDRNRNCSASPCFTCQEHGHMAWGCSKPTTATKWATSHWTARSLADKGPSLPVGMVVHLANPPRTSRQQTPPGPGFRLTRGRNRFPRPGKAAKEGEGGGRGTTEWWTEDMVATLQGEPQRFHPYPQWRRKTTGLQFAYST